MTGWPFLAGVVVGVAGGLALGFALGRRLPPKPARKVATMRHKFAALMQRHVTVIVSTLVVMVGIGYFALSYAVVKAGSAGDDAQAASDRATSATFKLTIYTNCVAGYLADLGAAQTPRSEASLKVTEDLHQVFVDTRLHGGNSPQVIADVDHYLAAYREYQRIVLANPLPSLPGCLSVQKGSQ